jgi:hypothetical protein
MATISTGTTPQSTSGDGALTILTAPSGFEFDEAYVINESGPAGFVIPNGDNPIRLPAGPSSVKVFGPFSTLSIQRISGGTNLSTVYAYGKV